MPYPPRATNDNPYGPQVRFRTEDVLPPTALYLSLDDTLVVQTLCYANPVTGTATIRMLLPDGTLQVDYYQLLPSTINPVYSFAVVPPVEGYLLSAIVQINSTVYGSIWCQMVAFKGSVVQPIVSLPPVAGLLVVQGYVDESTYLAWPNSPAVEAGDGAGRMQRIALTPAVGANWILQAGGNQRLEVIAVSALLITSAAAGTRVVSLLVYDGLGNPIVRFPTNFTQAPSLGYAYDFYDSAAHIQTNTVWITAPIPQDLFLDPGMSLRSAVQSMDVNDFWNPVTILVREWMGVGHA